MAPFHFEIVLLTISAGSFTTSSASSATLKPIRVSGVTSSADTPIREQ